MSEYSRFFELYSKMNVTLIKYWNKNQNDFVKESFNDMAKYDEILNVSPLTEDFLSRQNNYLEGLIDMDLKTDNDVKYQVITRMFSEFKADMYEWCYKNKAV